MQPDGQMPAPPFHLVDNEYTWLDQTDLVLIDPVGTRLQPGCETGVEQEFLELARRYPLGGRVHSPVSDAQ
jgi:hypothetical protein